MKILKKRVPTKISASNFFLRRTRKVLRHPIVFRQFLKINYQTL